MNPDINEYTLQITGRVTLPEPLAVSTEYDFKIKAQVTSSSLHDNQDGTYNMAYKAKIGALEALTALGSIIAKPKTKASIVMYKRLYAIWLEHAIGGDFDDWYAKAMNILNQNCEELLIKEKFI